MIKTRGVASAVVCYREYLPCAALRRVVRAFFTFAPLSESPRVRVPVREVLFEAGESFCSPLFADGRVSMVFSLPRVCRVEDGTWVSAGGGSARGDVVGPMTRVGRGSSEDCRPEMIGAYLHAAVAPQLCRVPAYELTDRIVALEDIWSPSVAQSVTDRLESTCSLDARIAQLEGSLLGVLSRGRPLTNTVDVPGVTALIQHHRGQVTVGQLSEACGVSRQHLCRVFRDAAGVTPKQYCRLVRFHEALRRGYRRSEESDSWAEIAAASGYADQSHMIAEFREFSSLTPDMLTTVGRWFHPFLLEAVKGKVPQADY